MSSPGGTAEAAGSGLRRQAFEEQGFTPGVIETLLKCRRPSSNKLYDIYLKKWRDYCHIKGTDPIYAIVPVALEFLHTLRAEPGVS